MNIPINYDQHIKPIRAHLLDRNRIEAHIQYQIKMNGLPENAKKAYKPKNTKESLVSIPVICNNRCEVKFTKQHVKV